MNLTVDQTVSMLAKYLLYEKHFLILLEEGIEMKTLKALAGLVAAIVVTIGLSQNASANTMTFEQIGFTGQYSQDGISYTAYGGDWHVGFWDDTDPNLHTHGGSAKFDMGGTAFDLVSLDLITNLSSWAIVTSGGGYYALPYDSWGLPSIHIDFSTMYGFSDITSFKIVDGFDCLGVDNIETSAAAVPEPSTFVLLGAGLLGAGFFTRRRKQS